MKFLTAAYALIGLLFVLVLALPREAMATPDVIGSNITATEGTNFSGTVGSFVDPTGLDASFFTATIDWGDGTTTAGALSGCCGSFTVSGSHTYADEGTFTGGLTITNTSDSTTGGGLLTASVSEADALSASPLTLVAVAGTSFTGTVANFTDTDTGNTAADFTATIVWGDGTTTAGTVSGSAGSFSVSGTHTYAAAGPDTVSVTLSDDAPGTATATAVSSMTVIPTGLHVADASFGPPLVETNNFSFGSPFTDSDLAEPASNFTATIDWGDGTTTSGSVSGSNGQYEVSGGPHAYADEGVFDGTIHVHDIADNIDATGSLTVTAGENDSLSGTPASFSEKTGVAFTHGVGTFTDTDTSNVASDFTATINWGDGTTTAGTVSGGAGSFAVGGTHTYAAGGVYTLTTMLTDDAPGTATATAVGQVTVASGLVVSGSSNSTPEAAAFSGTVGTFTDVDAGQAPGNFTATIDWGDGTTTAGTVAGSSGSFTVSGSHTYADEGSFSGTVSVHDTADNLTQSAAASFAVTEADSLAGTGVNFSGTNGVAFSGTVANFTDTDTSNVASDFTATINWGDGTTTAGMVSGGAGSFAVGGTHTYTFGGIYTVTATLADDPPGTATGTAQGRGSIAGPSATAGIPMLGWPGLLALGFGILLLAPVLLRRFD